MSFSRGFIEYSNGELSKSLIPLPLFIRLPIFYSIDEKSFPRPQQIKMLIDEDENAPLIARIRSEKSTFKRPTSTICQNLSIKILKDFLIFGAAFLKISLVTLAPVNELCLRDPKKDYPSPDLKFVCLLSHCSA